MNTFVRWVRGDTRYPLVMRIEDENGAVVDLANVSTVTFRFQHLDSGATVDLAGAVQDVAGLVKWTPADGDYATGKLAAAGTYSMQVTVIWIDLTAATYPSLGTVQFALADRIGGIEEPSP